MLRPIDIKRQKLIEEYIPLALTQARYFCNKYNLEEYQDDYKSIAFVGLCKAAKKFKWNKKIAFSSFANIYILGAMLDEFRQTDPLTRKERIAKINGEEVPTIEFISLYTILPHTSEGCYTYADTLEAPTVDLIGQVDRNTRLRRLQEAIEALPNNERKVMTLYLTKEFISLRDIGIILGYSEPRIVQFLAAAKEKIKEFFNGTKTGKQE